MKPFRILLAAAAVAFAIAAAQCTTSTTLVDPSPVKCQMIVAPQSESLDASGGGASVAITVDPECAWNASAAQPWITITSTAPRQGSGKADYRVAPNSALTARHGEVVVGDQRVQVDQAGCVFGLSQTSQDVADLGGPGSVNVTTGSACSWTATSSAEWITIAEGASGTGTGSVSFTVASNTGPSRSGSLTIGGQTFTVNQTSRLAAGCPPVIAPTSQSFPSQGGPGTVSVTGGPACTWTATSNASWITIVSGSSGTGNGTVTFSVATGSSRSGTLTIAGQTFTVTQAAGCSYSLAPPSANVGSAGGPGSSAVSTTTGCTWTAASNAVWITNVSPASGTGGGTVTFTVQANTGPQRSGALTIGGQTFTVTQATGCSYSIAPSNRNVAVVGDSSSTTVSTVTGCAWTAGSNAAWITNVSPASGSGGGTVTFTGLANSGPQRSGTLTIAGQTLTVTQPAGCTYSIAPSSVTIANPGGSRSTTVTATSGWPPGLPAPACSWTAASNVSWIKGVSPTSGTTGGGIVTFAIDANTGPQRTGTLTIAGQTFTVTQ